MPRLIPATMAVQGAGDDGKPLVSKTQNRHWNIVGQAEVTVTARRPVITINAALRATNADQWMWE